MIERIAQRFEGRWMRGYVRGKLRSDPIYATVAKLLSGSPLPLLDIGCGIGLLGLFLRENGYTQPIHGIDFDERKIAQARRAAGVGDDLHFEKSDAVCLPDFSGNIAIIDVLHYLDAPAQRALLEAVVNRIPPGGLCVIRECPRGNSLRFRITQLEEFFIRAISWMKSGVRHFPTVAEIAAPFEDRAFEIEVRPLWARTPFNSHLLLFRRSTLSNAIGNVPTCES